MPRFSIAEAAFAGLGLFGRHPLAALVWAGLGVLFLAILLLLFGPALASTVTTFVSLSHAGGTHAGGAAPAAAIFGLIGEAFGFVAILAVGSVVLGAVVTCAVYRAVINPEDSSLLYLRFGPSELWLIAVNFVLGLLISLAQTVLSIPLGLIALFNLGGRADPAMFLIVGLGRLAIYGVVIFLYLRFSMAGPMTYRDRRFRLFESWALTRGHGWSLLGVGALLGVTLAGMYLVLTLIGFAGGAAVIGGLGLGDSLKALSGNPPSTWLETLAPIIEWALLLFWVGGAILTPVTLAPWAFIFQRINPGESLAETFA
jgi:hypothetical protein